MKPARFDDFARSSAGMSRRQMLGALMSLVAATVIGRRAVFGFDNHWNGEPIHEKITADALRKMVGRNVLQTIQEANANTDVCNTDGCTFANEAYHYDNANQRSVICQHWRNGQNKSLNEAVASVVPSKIERNRDDVMTSLGRAIHAVQDFYSHTNWIELSVLQNRSPKSAPIIQSCVTTSLPGALESGYFDLANGVGLTGCPYRRVGNRLGAPVCVRLLGAPEGSACRKGLKQPGTVCERDSECCSNMCSWFEPPRGNGFRFCHEHLNKDYPEDKEGAGSGARMYGRTSYHTLAKRRAQISTVELFDEFRRRVLARVATKYPCYDGACVFRKLIQHADQGVAYDPDDDCMLVGNNCATSTVPNGTCCRGGCRPKSYYDKNRLNCKTCGNECPEGQECSHATCVAPCPEGKTFCSGACVDLLTDSAHCGTCDIACGIGQKCINGACKGTASGFCAEPQGPSLPDGAACLPFYANNRHECCSTICYYEHGQGYHCVGDTYETRYDPGDGRLTYQPCTADSQCESREHCLMGVCRSCFWDGMYCDIGGTPDDRWCCSGQCVRGIRSVGGQSYFCQSKTGCFGYNAPCDTDDQCCEGMCVSYGADKICRNSCDDIYGCYYR